MQDSAANTELWDLQKPTVMSRSRLFHLEPIGIGTLFVESLSGYIVRLANYHCVTVRQLIIKEIVPLMWQKGFPTFRWRSRINQLFKPDSSLIKNNEVRGILAETLIQSLEELTLRQDLKDLSLLREAASIINDRHMRKYHAWCPRCLEEWRHSKRVIFMPLIWLVEALCVCPQHRQQRLIDKCPSCQRQFPVITARLYLGFCPNCHSWLGSCSQFSNSQETDSLIEWTNLMRDPLEHQLSWIDNYKELLFQTQISFLPPKLHDY